MNAYCSRLAGHRQAGRVETLIAVVLAALLFGGLLYLFLKGYAPAPGGGEVPRNSTGVEAPPGESSPPAEAPAGAEKGQKEGSSGSVETDGSTPQSQELRRIHGRVIQTDGDPIADVCLRWVPAELKHLGRFKNDRAALGKDGEAARFPQGRLRNAFSRSVVATSGEDGDYSMEVPSAAAAGVMVACASGYEMQLREVEAAGEATTAVEIDFTLGSAGAISGKVAVRVSGDPAAGTVVQAGSIDPDRPALLAQVPESAPSAVVGPDGSYHLQGLRPGEYRVVVRTGWSDFLSIPSRQGRKVVLEDGVDVTDVDFLVDLGGLIRGRVLGPDDEPVAGARCSVVSGKALAAAMSGSVEGVELLRQKEDLTAEDGTFEIGGLPLEKYSVVVKRAGLAMEKSASAELTAESPEAEIEIQLGPGWSISGTVVQADGTPAADVTVRDLPDFAKVLSGVDIALRDDVKGKSDENGEFRLADLSPGKYELLAGDMKPEDIFAQRPETKSVVLDGTGDVTGVELVVDSGKSGGEITGVVVNDLGRPLEGASIRFATAFDFMGVGAKKATSAADGRFSLDKLTGAPFRVIASKDGHADTIREAVSLDTPELRLTLDRFARIRGSVSLADGAATGAGAKVKARLVDENPMLAALASFANKKKAESAVGSDGTFTLSVPPGKVQVIATVPGHAPAMSQTFILAPGEERTGVRVVVTVGATLRGRVMFSGAPVERATVRVRPAGGKSNLLAEMLPELFGSSANQVVTDEKGLYEIRHLAPGEYVVGASHDEYAPSDTESVTIGVDAERTLPDLVLRVGATVTGRVVQDGKGKTGMLAQLLTGGAMKQTMTGPDGRFEFKGLRAGDYMINVMDMAAMAKQKWILKSRGITVGEEEHKEVEIVFGTGHKVWGTIEGLPPGPMRVIALRRPGGPAPEDVDPLNMKQSVEASKFQGGITLILKDGPYEIIDVEPGKYILEVLKVPSSMESTEAFSKIDRTPQFREEITVREHDLKFDIRVR